MSDTDVRELAIERISEVLYDQYHWESRTDCRELAARYVDALGDLLPDAYIESRGGLDVVDFRGKVVRRIPLEERYITEWRVVD